MLPHRCREAFSLDGQSKTLLSKGKDLIDSMYGQCPPSYLSYNQGSHQNAWFGSASTTTGFDTNGFRPILLSNTDAKLNLCWMNFLGQDRVISTNEVLKISS